MFADDEYNAPPLLPAEFPLNEEDVRLATRLLILAAPPFVSATLLENYTLLIV